MTEDLNINLTLEKAKAKADSGWVEGEKVMKALGAFDGALGELERAKGWFYGLGVAVIALKHALARVSPEALEGVAEEVRERVGRG